MQYTYLTSRRPSQLSSTTEALVHQDSHLPAQPNTWVPASRLGDDQNFFEVYGQINKGLLIYNDGRSSELYPLVDNENSSTRAGFKVQAPVTDHAAFGVNFEFEWLAGF